MNGYCEGCSKYGLLLAELPDGTKIYRCYDCGRVWGERLVVFDVAYALTEHGPTNGQPAEVHAISLPVMAEA
jgi:hypothetical protein